MKIENYNALLWCVVCKGHMPLVTENDSNCPNCGKLLRSPKDVILTLDQTTIGIEDIENLEKKHKAEIQMMTTKKNGKIHLHLKKKIDLFSYLNKKK